MSESLKIYNLRRIYNGIQEDSCFSSFEYFYNWAEEKYKPGYTIYKLCDKKPHSTKNSYWYYASKALPDDIKSPICENCDKNMLICYNVGCVEYRRMFIENWNKYIHVPKVVPPEPEKPMVFRYEHPDLVREGIVFANSQSIP